MDLKCSIIHKHFFFSLHLYLFPFPNILPQKFAEEGVKRDKNLCLLCWKVSLQLWRARSWRKGRGSVLGDSARGSVWIGVCVCVWQRVRSGRAACERGRRSSQASWAWSGGGSSPANPTLLFLLCHHSNDSHGCPSARKRLPLGGKGSVHRLPTSTLPTLHSCLQLEREGGGGLHVAGGDFFQIRNATKERLISDMWAQWRVIKPPWTSSLAVW